MASANELILAPATIKSVRYQASSFQPVAFVCHGYYLLFARADLAVKSVDDLIALASKPGAKPLSYGSTGPGSMSHLLDADLARQNRLSMVYVPYRRASPAMQDVAGGQLDIAFIPSAPAFLQMAEAGRVRVLRVGAKDRSPLFPQYAPLAESESARKLTFLDGWIGLFASAQAPKAFVESWKAHAADAVKSEELATTIKMAGYLPEPPTSLQALRDRYKKDAEQVTQLVRTLGIQAS